MCLVVPEPKSNGSSTLIRRQLMRGKLSCMAPEIHREEPFDAFAVDVWALGTVLFVMTVGKRLYANPMDEVSSATHSHMHKLLHTLPHSHHPSHLHVHETHVVIPPSCLSPPLPSSPSPMPQGFKELLEGHGRDLIIRVAASRDVDLSPSLVDLIALMLHPDPQVRSLPPTIPPS